MKQIIYIAAITILSVFLFHSCKGQTEQIETLEQSLKFDCDSVNKVCPKWLDKDSIYEIINTAILPNNTWRFNYLLNIDSEKIANISNFKDKMRKVKLKDLSKNKTAQAILILGGTIENSYVDKNNKTLFILDFTKEDLNL